MKTIALQLGQSIKFTACIFAGAALLISPHYSYAAVKTWTALSAGDASGSWTTGANWSGGTAPAITDDADFNTLDITADSTITLTAKTTINTVTFGDTDTSSAAGWIITGNSFNINANPVTVNALGAGKSVSIQGGGKFAGTVGPNGSTLVKAGAGMLAISMTSSMSSLTVENGTLQLSSWNQGVTLPHAIILGDVANNSGKLILGAGSTAQNANGALSTVGTGANNAIVGGASANLLLTVVPAASAYTFNGVFGGPGANENNLAVTMSSTVAAGTGSSITWGKAGSTMAGNFTLKNTTLILNAANVLPSGAGAGNVILAPSSGDGNIAVLDLNGFNTTVNSLSSSGTSASSSIDNNTATPITLTVGTAAANPDGGFAGVIKNTGGGTISVVKNGSGTFGLNGINAYTGPTTINSGAIGLDGDGTIGDGTSTSLIFAGGNLIITASRSVSANPVGNPINITANAAITTTSAAATVDVNFTNDSIVASGGTTLTFRNDGADAATDQFEPRFSGNFTFNRPIVIDNGAIGKTRLNSFNPIGTTQTFTDQISGNGGFRRSASSGDGGVTIFSANNTYSGDTAVNNGTLRVSGSIAGGAVNVAGSGVLAGNGTIGGSVTVQSGGSLSPGASIGRLTINNTLTNLTGSTNVMELNVTGGTNDNIVGLTGVVYGGTLDVSSVIGTLAIGQSFKLYDSTPGTYSGAFDAIVPADPQNNAALAWDTTSLTVDGKLKIIASGGGGGGSPLVITNRFHIGTTLTLQGGVGTNGGPFTVLTGTNVNDSLANWSTWASGNFDGSGNFSVSGTVNTTTNRSFYIIHQP